MSDTLIVKPGAVLQDRYEVVRLLKRGSKSFIYEGVQRNLKLPVAIKVLQQLYPDPAQARQQVEQARIEAQLLAQLSHPSLVTVYDAFEVSGYPVLVVEQIQGRSLEEISQLAPRPIRENRVLHWGRQLLESLDYLHSFHPPVIVRDLQPSNIVLDSRGQLRLIDFGLAKQMDEKGRGTHEIARGVGEDGFAPLEQRAYTSTDARSDLYSFGATLYFLLTKSCPPAPAQRVLAAKDPLKDPREINPSVSSQTWELLQELMAHRPEGRPASAREVLERLGETAVPDGPRRCVDCKSELTTFLRQGVELDRCEDCGGLWLDHGELGQLIDVAIEDSKPAIADRPTLELEPDRMQELARAELVSKDQGRRERIRQLLRELFSLR